MAKDTLYLTLRGPITDVYAGQILQEVKDRLSQKPEVKKLYILLSCPGGAVDGGISLYNGLRSLDVKVITHNIAFVNSIGMTVFLAGDERYAESYSNFKLHGVIKIFLKESQADIHDLKSMHEEVQKNEEQLKVIFRERMKVKEADLDRFFGFDTSLNPTEALGFGIITSISPPRIPGDLDGWWITTYSRKN